MLKSVSFSGILVCERKSQQKDHVAKHRHSILLERFSWNDFVVTIFLERFCNDSILQRFDFATIVETILQRFCNDFVGTIL